MADVRLTGRDEEWLRWVGRWRGVTAGQIAAWFLPDTPSAVKIVERRARAWRAMGLSMAEPVLADVPQLHNLTAAGMRAVGLDGPVRHVNVGTCRHDVAVTDLAIQLRRERGARMVTEREIRAREPVSTERPRLALLAQPGAGRRLLYPDLVTVVAQQDHSLTLAHEVERAGKERSRLVALMLSYARSDNISRVRYYAHESVRARIERAAVEANERAGSLWGRDNRVFVTGWEWEKASS